MKIDAAAAVCARSEAAAAMAFALLLAIGSGGAAPVTVIDSVGARVELDTPARRIVSLAPHATELLFAAGAGSQVIGVITPADWPAEAAVLPRVGDSRAIDLERIADLRPDLVVAWPYVAPAQLEHLRNLGLAVYSSDPHTPEEIADDLERLGTLAGTRESALRAATSFRSRLAALRARERGMPRVRVFYEIWHLPLYTIGGGHLISAAIDLCGGENVFASIRLPAPSVSVESVLAAAPEAIVAGTDGALRPTWLDAWAPWRSVPAVARGNLLVVDANLLHRAGPRFIDGVEQLCLALDRARINLGR
ncbi:MAG TPA: cobalamin-binding protein [Casimicrobiaceae bacterium]|jgi:iron complex transport system substrate-binding protein|nr:cobalamin-binding protein [Casimicrobiaceae bacterium]